MRGIYKYAHENRYEHFKARLLERYGIELTQEVSSYIIWQIQHNQLDTAVKRVSKYRSIHCVSIGAAQVFVLYTGNNRVPYPLVTALPPTETLRNQYNYRRKNMYTEQRIER